MLHCVYIIAKRWRFTSPLHSAGAISTCGIFSSHRRNCCCHHNFYYHKLCNKWSRCLAAQAHLKYIQFIQIERRSFFLLLLLFLPIFTVVLNLGNDLAFRLLKNGSLSRRHEITVEKIMSKTDRLSHINYISDFEYSTHWIESDWEKKKKIRGEFSY